MMRREVYATTGPRMTVRLFGGFDFSEADWAGDWVRAGYTRGSVKAGDKITITFAPMRDGNDGGYIVAFTTAAGEKVGFTPPP